MAMGLFMNFPDFPTPKSMDWFKGKSTGNHRFSHYINMGLSCKFSLKPIH
jgi:hypothetical protein